MDPITNLMAVGTHFDVRAMLTRVIDFLKTRGITALFTSLTSSGQALEHTEALMSSLMDAWSGDLQQEERHRIRQLYVLKSRGMAHSDEVRNFQVTGRGIEIDTPRGRSGGAQQSLRPN